MPKLSQSIRAKKLRAMRRDETPAAKEQRLAHRRELMRRYREFERKIYAIRRSKRQA